MPKILVKKPPPSYNFFMREEKLKILVSQEFGEYSPVDDIPFLFKNSNEAYSKLRAQCSIFLISEKNRLASLKSRATDITRKKVENHIQGRSKQISRLEKLIGSFFDPSVDLGIPIEPLNPYEELIFRDWCWENSKEIEIYSTYISSFISGGNCLVLGAGACGLSYKLAQMNSDSQVIASDINPFLLLSSKAITNGKSVKFVDTPHFPKNDEFIQQSFKVDPKPSLDNHIQVFSDFLNSPFAESSFDHINASWFLDVIPLNLEDSLGNIVHHLKANGSFTYIGPANFHKADLSNSYTPQEIVSILQGFFSEVSFEFKEIEYLESGYSSQRRIENTLFITATSPDKSKAKLYTKIEPDSFEFNEKIQFKIAEVQTLQRILKHVHGGMKFEELAKTLQDEFGFSADQAMMYAKSVIQKINS